jgi:hypothetical protein
MSVGILASEPPQEIAVNKIKPEKRACVEQCSVHGQFGGGARRGTWDVEWRYGMANGSNTKAMIQKPLGAQLDGFGLIGWGEKLPSKMQEHVW